MVDGLIHGLLITLTALPGLAGIGATIGLPVLYRRAVREDRREQETGT